MTIWGYEEFCLLLAIFGLLIQMVISISKLRDALTLTALTAWSDLQQKKTVCACRRRMFSVSGSFPGDTSSELYLFRDCKICQINISQYMPFSSLEISSLQAPISSNFEHLSLCVDSFWLPAKVWILAEKLARMSLAPISSRISSKNRQTFWGMLRSQVFGPIFISNC